MHGDVNNENEMVRERKWSEEKKKKTHTHTRELYLEKKEEKIELQAVNKRRKC